MRTPVADAVWLNDTMLCSAEQLAEASGLPLEDVRDLIDAGVLVPVDDRMPSRAFAIRALVVARTARRLRDDFELDRHGVALALTLLKRIDELDAELQAWKVRISQSLADRR
jgi:chaperone modulatory protein CbpM